MARHHADRVIESVTSATAAARCAVAASWQRCFARHGLDPAARVPTTGEIDADRLAARREALGPLLSVAAPRLDDLHRMIAHCGRGVFLTDDEGLILECRAGKADSAAFRDWGLEAGREWSESAQGTNGIGTCVAEGRPLTIHRDQHYLPQNIGMSCIDAPVFDAEGRLVAALDVSSARADDTEGFNQLIGAMVVKVAAQIETDLFRAAHPGDRFLMLGEGAGGAAALVAVDRDDIVTGANRAARQMLRLERTGKVRPRPLRDLTGEGAQGLDGAARAVVIRALTRAQGNASAAARDLGIGRATLYRRMKRLGIDPATLPQSRDLSRD